MTYFFYQPFLHPLNSLSLRSCMRLSFVTFILIPTELLLHPSSTQISFYIPRIILLSGRGSQRQRTLCMINLTVENQMVVSRRRHHRKIDVNSRKKKSSINLSHTNTDFFNLKKTQKNSFLVPEVFGNSLSHLDDAEK